MMLYETLKHKYPELEADKDYILRQEGDVMYIAKWNSAEPQPEMQDLRDYWEQFKDEIAEMFKPAPTDVQILEQTQADLIFTLMMNGVI
jgi:hypothetical protein